jgi:hypothetical protein
MAEAQGAAMNQILQHEELKAWREAELVVLWGK